MDLKSSIQNTMEPAIKSPFCDSGIKRIPKIRRSLKNKKKTLCKDRKNGTCQKKICLSAHSEQQLIKRERYNNNKPYKENPCQSGLLCSIVNCKYYHSINEKRINICLDNLRNQKGWKVFNQILIISEAIPHLSSFNEEETREVIKAICELKIQYETQLGKALKGLEINLVQTKSEFVRESQFQIFESLREVNHLLFKSKDFTYIRSESQKQNTFIINNSLFVDQICLELRLRATSNLRLVITNIDKDWHNLCQLLESVSYLKDSLHKLDLEIRDIQSINLKDLEQKLRETLLPLINLRVVHLSFQMDFNEENVDYERKLIDIILDLLKDMDKMSSFNLQTKLSMFGISVAKKFQSLMILSDPCRRNTANRRKKLTQRLEYSILHSHLINKFCQEFVINNKSMPSILKFDFSNIYGLVPGQNNQESKNPIFMHEPIMKKEPRLIVEDDNPKKESESPNEGQRKIYAIKYVKEIDSLIESLIKMISYIPNSSIKKINLKFFAFDFFFESNSKKKVSSYNLKTACLLPSQNKPIYFFNSFFELSALIKEKLDLTFNYKIFSGQISRRNPYGGNSAPSHLVKDGNIKFLDIIMDSFKSLVYLKCPRFDLKCLAEIISNSKMPINIEIQYQFQQQEKVKRILTLNKITCQIRNRIITILKKYKAIQKKYPEFILRKEIILDTLNDLKLGKENIDVIFKEFIDLLQKQKSGKELEVKLRFNYLEEEVEEEEEVKEEELEEESFGSQGLF